MSLYVQMHKILCFSDGKCVSIAGFYEPSGARGTASNNSDARSLVHIEYCIRNGLDPEPFATYGDDFVGPYLPGEFEFLRGIGVHIKENSIRRSSTEFEFCSRLYRKNLDVYTSTFLGSVKTLVQYVHSAPSSERRAALVQELGPLGEYLAKILPSFQAETSSTSPLGIG